jgi:hypothetical protein
MPVVLQILTPTLSPLARGEGEGGVATHARLLITRATSWLRNQR